MDLYRLSGEAEDLRPLDLDFVFQNCKSNLTNPNGKWLYGEVDHGFYSPKALATEKFRIPYHASVIDETSHHAQLGTHPDPFKI